MERTRRRIRTGPAAELALAVVREEVHNPPQLWPGPEHAGPVVAQVEARNLASGGLCTRAVDPEAARIPWSDVEERYVYWVKRSYAR